MRYLDENWPYLQVLAKIIFKNFHVRHLIEIMRKEKGRRREEEGKGEVGGEWRGKGKGGDGRGTGKQEKMVREAQASSWRSCDGRKGREGE